MTIDDFGDARAAPAEHFGVVRSRPGWGLSEFVAVFVWTMMIVAAQRKQRQQQS